VYTLDTECGEVPELLEFLLIWDILLVEFIPTERTNQNELENAASTRFAGLDSSQLHSSIRLEGSNGV